MSSDFNTTMGNFIRDMVTTFPEYATTLEQWPQSEWFAYCKTTYPPNFFHIMYKNGDFITTGETSAPVYLLPGVDFKHIMQCPDISQHTRETIWQYLRLTLFAVVGDIQDSAAFGDAAHLFGAISPEEMQNKIGEVIGDMQSMFETMKEGNETGAESAFDSTPGAGTGAPPSAENIHENLNHIFGSKIGKFAAEIAEEWSAEFGINLDNTSSTADMPKLFEKLLKDPSQMFKMIQRVGERFKEKMASGEFTEKDIQRDIAEMASMLKTMPGMEKWGNMFSGMSQGRGGRGNGANTAAAAASAEIINLRKQMEFEQMKAKLQANREKVKKRAAAAAAKVAYRSADTPVAVALSDEELVAMFNNTAPSAGQGQGQGQGKKTKNKGAQK